MTISALPRKQDRRKILPPKRELTIAMSNSNEDAKDDATSAKLGKLLASYATASMVQKKHCSNKGAKRNPLDLSDSN